MIARVPHDQKICAFFHRHLIAHIINLRTRGKQVYGEPGIRIFFAQRAGILALLVGKAVDVAAAVGIRACVVRREIVRPCGHTRIFQNGTHHPFYKLGVI